MDWKHKHFNQQATFRAARERVLEAARLVAAESLAGIEDTADGFVARGYGAWHPEIAAFHLTSTSDGTRVAVELLVQRRAMRGYMLWDVGGYYNGQIDKWLSGISSRLGGTPEQVMVNKTTSGLKFQRGLLAGCLVYLIAGTCLAALAIPLDRAVFPRPASTAGPFAILGSILGLAAGVVVCLYLAKPEGPVFKFIRARLRRNPDADKQA
jgi:hypothetical protein